MRDTITRAFRDSTAMLYGKSPVTDSQLTDLVRVFVMGWGEAINFYDVNNAACQAFFNALEDTAQESFVAGPEWRWW